jgi:ribonuclease HI
MFSIKRRQLPQNSIYSAEQSAVINAIYSTKSKEETVIITDSLSTMIAVSDRKRTKNLKKQTIRKLIHQKTSKITLLWVPRHLGIPGNETADEAAKKALDEEIQALRKVPSARSNKMDEKEQQEKWES